MSVISLKKRTKIIMAVVLISLLTAGVLSPSLFNGFVEWDDPYYVTDNNMIRDISFKNFKEMFTYGVVGCYCPAALVSYAVEYRFFGLDPFVFHLVNLLLHIMVTVLVFFFILLIARNIGTAVIVAVLFGIHPLHVESVAWISERKDLLCAFFCMLALIVYVNFIRRGGKRLFFACFAFTLLALFSKPMAVMLPVIFLFLDHFQKRKFCKELWLEKIPFFVVAAVFGIVNLHSQISYGAVGGDPHPEIAQYFLPKAILFYVTKTFVPVNLSALYHYHVLVPEHFIRARYFFAALAVILTLAITGAYYSRKIRFGLAFFLITILPVLQLIPAGSAYAADRYMYLPSIGLFFVLAVLFGKVLRRIGLVNRLLKLFPIFFMCLWMAWLSVLAWERCGVWKDTETLFSDVIEKQSVPVAKPYVLLGNFFMEKGYLEKAEESFREAIRVEPGHIRSYNYLANLYLVKGDVPSATEHYENVLRMEPGNEEAILNIYFLNRKEFERVQLEKGLVSQEAMALNDQGIATGRSGDIDKAILLFKRAVDLAPDYPGSYHNLGIAYLKKGEHRLSDEYFKKTIHAYSRSEEEREARAEESKGSDLSENVVSSSDSIDEPRQRALSLNEEGIRLGRQGNIGAAIDLFLEAIAISPKYPESYNNLGCAYFREGDHDSARRFFEKALQVHPGFQKARENLKYLGGSLEDR